MNRISAQAFPKRQIRYARNLLANRSAFLPDEGDEMVRLSAVNYTVRVMRLAYGGKALAVHDVSGEGVEQSETDVPDKGIGR